MQSERRSSQDQLSQLHASYADGCRKLERLACLAHQYALWDDFGAKLSALYLRLKQGPIRALVMGQTSSGKSTLINAFAGDFIAPESAVACTLIPIWLMSHQANATQINKYRLHADRLPTFEIVGPGELIAHHHDIQNSNAPDDGSLPYVSVCSSSFPRLVTLIDSPGLNASQEDTNRLQQLFDPPAYATNDEADLPEIILYVTSMSNNLSDLEKEDIRNLIAQGVDPQHILIVKNEFRQSYALTEEDYEAIDPTAVNGLGKSFYSLLAPEAPTFFGSGGFDAFDADDFSVQSALSEAEARQHVFCLNALIARLHYVKRDNGVYDPTHFPPRGCTQEIFNKLLEAKEDERQLQILTVRDAWKKAGHPDYQPMRSLIDAIETHANMLAEHDAPRLYTALHALERMRLDMLETILTRIDHQEDTLSRALSESLEALKPIIQAAHGCPSMHQLKESVQLCDNMIRSEWKQAIERHDLRLTRILNQFSPAQTLPVLTPPQSSLTARLAEALINMMIGDNLRTKCQSLWNRYKWKDAELLAAYLSPASSYSLFQQLTNSLRPLIYTINKSAFSEPLLNTKMLENAGKVLDDRLFTFMEAFHEIQKKLLAWCFEFDHKTDGNPEICESGAAEACIKDLMLPDMIQITPTLLNSFITLDAAFLNALDIERLPDAQNTLWEAYTNLHRHGNVELGTIKKMVFEHVVCYCIRQLAVHTRISQEESQCALEDALADLHVILHRAFSPLFAALEKAEKLCTSALRSATERHHRRLEDSKRRVQKAFEQINQS